MANELGRVVADFETTLAAKVSAGATSATLQSATDDDGVTLTTGQYYLTIDGSSTQKEYWLCTITGTAVTSIQNITRQGTLSSGSVREHRVGASVKITNFGALLAVKNLLDGTKQLTSTNIMSYDANPSFTPGSNQLATILYADNLAIAGSPDSSATTKGIVEIATQTEVDTGDDSGSTTAPVVVTPSKLANVIQDASYVYAADAEASDTYVIALTPTLTALAAGQSFYFKANTANTTGATLNIDGLGAKNILKYRDQTLETGDIEAGKIVHVIYDGTSFQLQTPVDSNISTANSTLVTNNIGTLTGGSTTNADSLHTHSHLVPAFYPVLTTTQAANFRVAGTGSVAGYSDAATPLIALSSYFAASGVMCGVHQISTTFGYQPHLKTQYIESGNPLTSMVGAVYIGTDLWRSGDTTAIRKNGSAGSFVSGSSQGPLGHDPANSYLLMLTSTTNIRRFSGISGTALTQVDNITLDTAVTVTGFLYDNTNARYICLDKTANVIRRFDSSGTTIDTSAYDADDTFVKGITFIGDRVYLIVSTDASNQSNSGEDVISTSAWQLIPTAMTR